MISGPQSKGVGTIDDIEAVAAIVDRLEAEYRDGRAAT